ncbi:MAG: hypothetical protein AABZ06_00660 [Bdellovibrionota bacterium]
MIKFMLFFMCCIIAHGCSTAEKRERENARKQISNIVPYSIHFRKVTVSGARDSAEAGEQDYARTPLPDKKFDCAPIKNIFDGMEFKKLRGCLSSIKEEVAVLYRLKREISPYLLLDDPENSPACLRESLNKIPIPREIMFESGDEGMINCYSARMDVEANEIFWIKMPVNKIGIKVRFPLVKPPLNDDDTILLLTSWALTPFWRGEKLFIDSRIVPDGICSTCLGEQNMVNSHKRQLKYWPAGK